MGVAVKAFNSTRCFGVELEVDESVSRRKMGEIVSAADPYRGVTVSDMWTMSGGGGAAPSSKWSVKTDSTCGTLPGAHGHEVASYKACGGEDIKTVGRVAEALRDGGCRVNEKCGVHVHGDVGSWTTEQVGVMLGRWCRVEGLIAQALPPHRRKNRFARLMTERHAIDYGRPWTGASLYAAMEPQHLDIHHNQDKRVAINLIGYATGRRVNKGYSRKTAEFRLAEGTLDRYDVENWTRLYLHFLDECAGKPMPKLQPAGLDKTLTILGLLGADGQYVLLSPELQETKVWFLRRLLKYTGHPDLFGEVVDRLNRMVDPVERYVGVPADEPQVGRAA